MARIQRSTRKKEEDFQFYPEEEEEDYQQPQAPKPKPLLKLPEPSPIPFHNQINNKKRLWSNTNNSTTASTSAQVINDKRNRVETSVNEPEDEEWLRFSPENVEMNDSSVVEEEEEKFISRFVSEIEGNCMAITGLDGSRVYAKMTSNVEMNDSSAKKLNIKGYANGLISEPISVLMDKMDQEALAKALQDSSESPNEVTHHETPGVSEKLWVEKYAPNSFTELLSDEQTNREVLLWLKQWDSGVFGSDIRSTKDDVLSSLRRHSTVTHHKKLSDTSFTSKNRRFPYPYKASVSNNLARESSNFESNHGIWKKTLKGAGPPDHKINASDDRSSSTIEAKILDVVQMNSIMSDAKPKCLVIDEIDGALGDGKGAVEVILKMVICICNDLYAPALRPLRQVAKVHVFVQPTVNRVVSRLKYICHKEGFKTTSISLAALAEYTECDIRSCLNTLQFLNKKKQKLNLLEIGSQVIGRKDVSRSAFDVWKEIFQRKKAKRETKSMNRGSTLSSEFDFLHSLVSNRGEHELTMDGIHENMLQLQYHDPLMKKTVDCLNILGISDYIHQYIMLNSTDVSSCLSTFYCNSYSLSNCTDREAKYSVAKVFSEIPNTVCGKEGPSKVLAHQNHAMSLKAPVALHLHSEREKDDLAQLVDTLHLHSITFKNRKSVPVPVPVPGTLRHEAALEAPTLTFDPPIDEFINFKDYKSEHSVLSFAMKQVLMHEVKKKFLRESDGRCTPLSVGDNTVCQALPTQGSGKARTTVDTNAENHLEMAKDKLDPGESKLKASTDSIVPGVIKSAEGVSQVKAPGATKKPSNGASNFLDRFRKMSGKDSQNPLQPLQNRATLERDSRPLLFKFNEGFTNAVKRPVRIRDLLL
ncbi:hypothetical protein IFM89_027510 [Coptis chinensis]|uniref:Chromosome transmission fidelity protein 18 homolog n=1 Tax=Coptis chinensis TaxID=261450 RepID=A0A835I5S4_9MAGN|nr:hypothetical protein IFM89_027510 [Coptis chinensis]